MQQTDSDVVLITGAMGQIGQELTKRLSDRYTVVGFDLPSQADGERVLACDITNPASRELAFRDLRQKYGERIASVIHLAAYFDFSGKESPLYDAVNVEGTRGLLRGLQDFEVGQFIYSGTMLVHQPGVPGERIDEDSPLDPQWAYPESKLKTEQVIAEEAGEIPVLYLRLAGVYDAQTAVPTLSHQIARIYERTLESHLFAGDPQAGQALLHQEDMVELFVRAVDRRDTLDPDLVILAGEPEAMSYDDLQRRIADLVHGEPDWETIALPPTLAKAGARAQVEAEPAVPDALDEGEPPFVRPFMIDMASDHYALDISRARTHLDWEPEHSIETDIEALIESLKGDPVGWYENNGITPPPWLRAADEKVANPETVRARHERNYRAAHARSLWAHWANAGLGVWLMTSPPLLGYVDSWMVLSDVIAGALILVFALLSMSWRLWQARWITAALGLWVMFAPLVLWAPTTGAYLNGTLVGLLVMSFAVAVRPPPGVSAAAAETGPSVPKGWSYSPSDWFQRLPVIILAVVGLLISRYLTAYQLGSIGGVWEPFFAGPDPAMNGTETIITSQVSESWPVPDAGLGAVTYALEIVVGAIGSARRWRTMPWLTTLFGIMIVPLGSVSIFFIVIQPIVIGTYCTLCLVAALAMLFQIPFSIDELVATYQFLRRRHRAGQPWLKVFFTGDTDEGPTEKQTVSFERKPQTTIHDMISGGMAPNWTLAGSAMLGLVLMLVPALITWDNPMSPVFHISGALAITVAVIAFAPVARLARVLNMVIGVALVFAPFIAGGGWLAFIAAILGGIVLIALSIPRGPVHESYGDWDRLIR